MEDDARESPVVRWLDDRMVGSLAIVQRLLIAAVAIALVILSVMALWDTIVLVRDELLRHDITKAITVGVDTVFLTVILLELLHTVIGRERLAQQVPDFIIIGITSAIRHGLSLVATSAHRSETVKRMVAGKPYTLSVPSSGARDTVISLVINSGGVLIMVAALWLVRHTFSRAEIESP